MIQALKDLKKEILHCDKCKRLKKVSKYPMPHIKYCKLKNAKVFCIGRNPGIEDDYSDISFKDFIKTYKERWWHCKFGDYLKMKFGSDLVRGYFFFTNVCKCSSPENKGLKEMEKDNCAKFLKRQIEIVNPKFIIAFGSDAKEAVREYDGKAEVCNFIHPAFFTYRQEPVLEMKQNKSIEELRGRIIHAV